MKKRLNKRITKRGIIMDVITILIIITSIAVTLLVAKTIYDQIGTALSESDIATNVSMTAYNDFDIAWGIFDTVTIFIVIALTIGLIITSFLIPTHPIFMIVQVIGMGFIIFVSMVLSNFYEEISGNVELSGASANFTRTNFILNYLPLISVAIVLVASVVNWARGVN